MNDIQAIILLCTTLYLGVGFVILGKIQNKMILLKRGSLPWILLSPSILFIKGLNIVNKPNVICFCIFMPMYGYMIVSSFVSYQLIKPLIAR